jgi:tetratricopeptide (TPR) repeat protein
MFRLFVSALLCAALLSFSATAQDLEEMIDWCEDETNPDRRIAGCSALIDSGLMDRSDLALSYAHRGAAYVDKGQMSKALSDLDRAIELYPSDPSAYFNRGLAHAALGRHDRAIADFDQRLRFDPTNSAAREKRCASVLALGRSDPACGAAAAPRGGTAGARPATATSYVGCRAENTGIDPIGPQGRVLAEHCTTSALEYAGRCTASAPMTVDLCVAECASRGYAYAGVQYRNWCHCGNNLAQDRASTACTMPCAGNPTQICGGQSAISVFRTRP